MTPPLLLGRPGNLVPLDGRVDAYTTRIGGTPVLPEGVGAMPDLHCQHCKEPLVLLLQSHAPVAAAQERFIYLLGCATDKCPGTWIALRCQLPSASTSGAGGGADGQAAPATGDGGTLQPKDQAPGPELEQQGGWGGADAGQEGSWGTAAADDWGVGAAGQGWGEALEEAGGSAFDFDDLNAALDAAASARAEQEEQQAAASQQAQQQRRPAAEPEGGVAASAAGLQSCYAARCLPSFYLSAQPEPAAAAKLPKHEREHLQQLLAQYEREAGGGPVHGAPDGGASAAAAGADSAAAAAAGACLPSVEGGAESWAGEGYEPDAVLHADKARAAGFRPGFIKFSKRLAACPDQCARYSLGGTPLWPADAPPAPRPCAQCGAPTTFEVQLMAPAIHYLEESAEWLEEEGASSGEVAAGQDQVVGAGGQQASSAGVQPILRPPPSWEWATVAVYSCSRSCPPGEGGFVEEQTFVENE